MIRIIKNGQKVDIYTYEQELLRVPSVDGYNTDVFSLPLNNIILRNKKGGIIEITTGKIDVEKSPSVVYTSMLSGGGTVKELMSKGDYKVTIKAQLVAGKGGFPFKEIKLLNDILDDISLEVASAYLDNFGINRLVLSELKFNQSAVKFFNVLPIELKFNSDFDYGFLVEDT